MKTKLFTLLTLLVLGVIAQGFAAEKYTAQTTNEAVVKMVKSKIQFPAFLKTDGVKKAQLLVEFKVNEDGSLNVLNTNQTDERVKKYVMDQLENVQLSTPEIDEDEVYVLKLNFQLL
jgi:hypothetical protein